MTSRFGRRLQPPVRYDPSALSSDDVTDDDESIEMSTSESSGDDTSLDGFIVDDVDLELDVVRYRDLIRYLCHGASEDDVSALLMILDDAESEYPSNLRGALAEQVKNLGADLEVSGDDGDSTTASPQPQAS